MSVPRSPRISLFANMLAWISICVPLSGHVHVCLSRKVFFLYYILCVSVNVSVCDVDKEERSREDSLHWTFARATFIFYVSSINPALIH